MRTLIKEEFWGPEVRRHWRPQIRKYDPNEERNYHGEWTSGGDAAPATKAGRDVQVGDQITYGKHGAVTVTSIGVHPRDPNYHAVVGTKSDGTTVKFDISGNKRYPVSSTGNAEVTTPKPTSLASQVQITKADVADLRQQLGQASRNVNENLQLGGRARVADAVSYTKKYGTAIDAKIQELTTREMDRLGMTDEVRAQLAQRPQSLQLRDSKAMRLAIRNEYVETRAKGITAAIAGALRNMGAGTHTALVGDGNGDHEDYEIKQSDIDTFENGLDASAFSTNVVGVTSDTLGVTSDTYRNGGRIPLVGENGQRIYVVNGKAYASSIGMDDAWGGYHRDAYMQTFVLPSGAKVPSYDLYMANPKAFKDLGVSFSKSNNAGFRMKSGNDAELAIMNNIVSGEKIPSGVKLSLVRDSSLNDLREALTNVKDLRNGQQEVENIRRAVTFGVLGQLRKLGTVKDFGIVQYRGSAKEQEVGKTLIENAAQYLPSDLISGLRLAVITKPNSSGRSDNSRGVLTLKVKAYDQDEKESTALHEIWHSVESNTSDIATLEQGYWRMRAPKERTNVSIGGGKGDPDTFQSPYSGRVYGFSNGKNWEIGSMGIEGLYANTKTTRNDDDYRAFMYGMLTLGGRK